MSEGLELRLFVGNLSSHDDETIQEIEEYRDSMRGRMERLSADRTIADSEVVSNSWEGGIHPDHRKNSGGQAKRSLEKYDEFKRWATGAGVSIEPYFTEGDTYIYFPDICLAAYDGLDVRGVFPCSDETTVYTIEDYLDALEAGEDWRDWKQANQSITPDWGKHGDIKLYLIHNSDDLIGEEWNFATDEYGVQTGRHEQQGRIDLFFEHRTDTQFLLVEVKPDSKEVDSAFGQILRYRYQFLNDRAIPDLRAEDIRLAIAAPEFYDSHQQAADEIGVQLIRI